MNLTTIRETAIRTGLSVEQVLLVHLDSHYVEVCHAVKGLPTSKSFEAAIDDSIAALALFKTLLIDKRSLGAAVNETGPRLVWDQDEEDA